MLGVSTCWRSLHANNGEVILGDMASLGIKAIELEYRVSPEVFAQMRPALERHQPMVISVHNVFPAPEPPRKPGGDAFLFSSEDEEERALAVKYAVKTMEIAQELGAKAVVFHLGRVPMESRMEEVIELHKQGGSALERARAIVDELLRQRKELREKSFQAVLLCLEELNKEAEKRDLYVGVENRYFFHQIPDFEEIGSILDEFRGSNLRYWHDVGHAVIQEKLGVSSQKELLEAYSSQMVGIHLHDVKDYKDHFAPGSGEVDFCFVQKHVSPSTIKIVEAHPYVSPEELSESLRFLEEMGIS